jgi:hypothetical protein
MKSAPIFLASKIATIASNSLSEDEEDEVRTPTESRLLKPAEVSTAPSTHLMLHEHVFVVR